MPTLTEAEVVAQLSAQHTKYTTGASGQVLTDHNARVTAANAAKTQITNATFSSVIGTEAPGERVTGKVYSGGNVVAPINATTMEADVRTAMDADELFTHGGPYGAAADYSRPSPYVDGTVLVEGSKLTGEKLF